MPAPKPNIEQHPFGDLLKQVSDLPIINWKRWMPEHSRSAAYLRAVSENTTGLMGQTEVQRVSIRMLERHVEQAAECRPYPSYIAFIEGDPGCRKSSALQKVLRNPRFKKTGLYTVIAPTTILRADWADKLALKNKLKTTGKGAPKELVQTFETALLDQNLGSLIIRDEDKFPKGYEATVALMYPHARFHVMLGDRFQSQWHEPNADCLLNDGQIPGEGEFYAQYTDTYLIGTWRFGPNIANFFRMPTFSNDGGGIHFSRDMVKSAMELRRFFPNSTDAELISVWRDALILYAADGAKRWGSDLLGRDTDTYSGSQGLTAPLSIIVVDQRSLAMGDPRLLYTAMTRSQNVIIVNLLASSGEDQMRIIGHPILSKLLQYQHAYVDGKPVMIKCTAEGSVNIKEIVGDLPRTTRLVLSGPPEKLRNWGSVAKWYDKDQLRFYLDPDTGEVALPMRGGTRLRRDEPAYKDAFNFYPYIDSTPVYKEPEIYPPDYVPAVKDAKTHLPQVLPSDIDERNHHDVMTRYSAELSWKGIFSEQFQDTPMVRADSYQIFKLAVQKHMDLFGVPRREANRLVKIQWDENNPTYFDPHSILWGANQKSSDAAAFAAGVAQRIRRQTREENIREFHDEQHFGNALWQAFHRYMNWGDPIPWDANLFEECIIEFQERRADRSEALKKMSLNRADPDYVDFLTAKTQWKMKSKSFEAAKPLQTILVRSDEYVFKFGPLGIYLLRKLLEHCPDYVYIHAKKTEKDLQDWLRDTPRDTTYVMSDVSGFDSSVRGASVTNELRFMEHFGVPQDLRDAYKEDKMDFKTATIHFGIMRFSGEIFTFLFNTTHTMSREALKYRLMPGERMMGAGDDLLRFSSKPISPEYFPYSAMDPTIEKRFEDVRGEFCSFITKNGITVKDPRILWRRLAGQVERGKIHDVVLGYFLHFALNYRNRDDLFDILNEDEMDHQMRVNNFFFREAGKLSKMAKKIDWSRVHVDEEHRTAGTAAGALTFLHVINEYLLSPISAITETEVESAYSAASSSSYLYD